MIWMESDSESASEKTDEEIKNYHENFDFIWDSIPTVLNQQEPIDQNCCVVPILQLVVSRLLVLGSPGSLEPSKINSHASEPTFLSSLARLEVLPSVPRRVLSKG